MKLTSKRKKIATTLEKQHDLVSARELSEKISDVDQATVYRTLDLFVKEGIAKKFTFNGSEARYESSQVNHHHAVCGECDKVIHFSITDKDILKKLHIQDFNIASVELTVRGKCA